MVVRTLCIFKGRRRKGGNEPEKEEDITKKDEIPSDLVERTSRREPEIF